MKLFWYQAMNADGALVRGSGEHAELSELVADLLSRGLHPYRVWSLPDWMSGWFLRPLKPTGIAEFCRFLGQQLQAGADLRQALSDAAQSASTTRLRMLCGRIRWSLERGDSLSTALQRSRAFPPLLGHLAVIGQETGQLGRLLLAVSVQYEHMQQLRSAIARSLIYPSAVLLVLLLSASYWTLVVIPKLTGLFSSLQVPLPTTTQRVLALAGWLEQYGLWLLILLLPVLLLLLQGGRSQMLRPVMHRLLWWLPGIRVLERMRTFHAFFSHLGIMHGAGLTLSRSLQVLCEHPLNAHFGQRIQRLQTDSSQGLSLSRSMERAGIFERFALSMMRLGEQTGSLEQQCHHLSEHYAARLRQFMETGAKLFEPLVLVLLAGLLLLVASTLLGPVYDMAARTALEIRP